MKISECNLKNLLNALKNFTYTKQVAGQTVTVNVILWEDSLNDYMIKFFERFYGDRKADDIAQQYKDGDLNTATVANIIKVMCVTRWKHYLGMWEAEYNPTWNVEGSETRTIQTDYGKIVTMARGTSVTTEQLVAGETTTEQITAGENTTEQITAGETTTEQLTDSQSIDYVSPQDSQLYNPAAKNTNNSGKIKGTSNSGKTKVTIDDGETKVTSNSGKMKSTNSGNDSDTASGRDTVTDTFTRGGNLGITMTQQLLSAEKDFWSHMDFFSMWFKDIANQLALPMWEV